MGASVSSAFAAMMANVSTNVRSTTRVTGEQAQLCDSEVNINAGCNIQTAGGLIINGSCNEVLNATQVGNIASDVGLQTDVALDLLQQAQSDTSGWGIGFSSANTAAVTSATVSSGVVQETINTFSQTNTGTTTFNCDGDLSAFGTIDIDVGVNQSLTGSQTGTVSSTTSVQTAVSETVSQTATATVSGLNLSLIGVAVAVIIVFVVLRRTGKSSSSTAAAVKGGARFPQLGRSSILWLIVAACSGLVSYVSYSQRIPCNYSGQCSGSQWYDYAWGCSCTDHLSCANENKPLGDVGAPLLWLNGMKDSGTSLYNGHLRKMAVRAMCGYDSNQSEANNSGYNVKNYMQMRKAVKQSSVGMALLEFAQRKMTSAAAAIGEGSSNDSIVTQIIDPAANASTYTPICTEQVLSELLPLTPARFTDDQIDPKYSCVVVAEAKTNDGYTC